MPKITPLHLCWLALVGLLYMSKAHSQITLSVIGDHGSEGENAAAVARLAKSWAPDHIISTGDVNYGGAEDFDTNVGTYYSPYIFPYNGIHSPSPVKHNRFWPCLGNHDYKGPTRRDSTLDAFFGYFPALGKRPFYDLPLSSDGVQIEHSASQTALLHLFFLCSDPRFLRQSQADQDRWFKEEVARSPAPWKIVVYHQPSYSSQMISPAVGDWPEEVKKRNCERTIDPSLFDGSGVSAVLCGHAHVYERFDQAGVPYIINGLGGDTFYRFDDADPVEASRVRYADQFGALQMKCDPERLSFVFQNISGDTVDTLDLFRSL